MHSWLKLQKGKVLLEVLMDTREEYLLQMCCQTILICISFRKKIIGLNMYLFLDILEWLT